MISDKAIRKIKMVTFFPRQSVHEFACFVRNKPVAPSSVLKFVAEYVHEQLIMIIIITSEPQAGA